jgi:NADPH:quinone reductase-like Zn-dependent oxidoreductase
VIVMKAIIQDGSGSADVLHLREVEKPVLPDDRVLLRVRAASVNALDWHNVHGGRLLGLVSLVMRQSMFPIRGVDVAGQVEAVGRSVTRLRPGDEVFGTARGTFAEFAIAREDRLVPKPPQLSFAQAGAMGVAGVTALQGLRDRGRVTPGQRVLIYGAGGGVGTFAVQIAKALGAHVTAVTSAGILELVRSLGPDAVIDYAEVDITRRPERYDVIFDVAATRSFADYRRVLSPNGRVVLAGAAKGSMARTLSRALAGLVRSRYLGSRWLVPLLAEVTYEDLVVLKELVESGTLCPAIDRQYSLSEAAEAVRYVGSGQARAKVVINVT